MKRLLFVFFLLWQIFPIFSQDWAPVRVNDTVYYYRNDNVEEQFIYGVSVDSTLTSVDSVGNLTQTHFFASSIFSDEYPSFPYVFYPVFTTPKVQVSDNQKDWKFLTTDNQVQYHIKTGYPVGTMWTYNIAKQITAEITGYTTSIIGTFPGSLTTIDSVINISLSDNGTLVISKHYGLIYAQSQGIIYRFLGIKNQPIGKKLPEVQDIFAYHVGDSLQFESYVRVDFTSIAQLKVTDIYQQNDSLFFIMKGRSMHVTHSSGLGQYNTHTNYNNYVDTTIVVSLDSIQGKELLNCEPFHYIGIPNSDSIFLHSLSGAKWQGNRISRYLMAYTPDKQEWTEGLGEVNKETYSYGGVKVVSKRLSAYQLANGEENGKFINIADSSIITKPNEIEIRPNPANTSIKIFVKADSYKFDFTIYDSQGKHLYQQIDHFSTGWNHFVTVDVSALPVGLYFLKVNDLPVEKLVIYR